MSEQKYELAFYGKLIEGASLQQTKELVAQLFKTSVDQIERVVIRNKLDQDTAMKYIVALKKRGALCQIEEMGKPEIAVNFDAVPTSTSTPEPPQESMPDSAPSEAKEAVENTVSEQKPIDPPTQAVQKPPAKASMSVTGLPIVGDKVDDILRATHFDLAPVGVRLEDEKQVTAPELHALDDIGLAPVGSDLVEHKEALPVSQPDISHIKLAPKE